MVTKNTKILKPVSMSLLERFFLLAALTALSKAKNVPVDKASAILAFSKEEKNLIEINGTEAKTKCTKERVFMLPADVYVRISTMISENPNGVPGSIKTKFVLKKDQRNAKK